MQPMLSVIIPTYNAAAQLPRTLSALVPGVVAGVLKEVIICDGGSSDETCKLAEGSGANFISGPKGRGVQLKAGAKAARGEWLLFLHADTELSPGWEGEVERFMERAGRDDTPPRAGYFTFGLDDPGLFARIMEAGVRLRTLLFALPYGDQGLLIERRFYEQLGGYAELPLMEDVEFVRRIGRKRLRPLAARATTSARRYHRDGFAARIARNSGCLALYFLRVSPARIARFYR
jgi:rSAM/selenodomain-associated transferase 2